MVVGTLAYLGVYVTHARAPGSAHLSGFIRSCMQVLVAAAFDLFGLYLQAWTRMPWLLTYSRQWGVL